MGERCTSSELRPHNPRPTDSKNAFGPTVLHRLFQSHIPAFTVGDTPRSDHVLSVCLQSWRPSRHMLLLDSDGLSSSLPNFESTVLSDVSPAPRLNSRSVFWAGQPFSLRKKKRNVLHVGVSVCVSCSMWLCGNLWLFTQVLVEFRLQETGIRVVLHQAVYPFLGGRKAATCSLLYILGN